MTSPNQELAKLKYNTCEFRSKTPVVRLWENKPGCGPCPPRPYTSFYCSRFNLFPFLDYTRCETCEAYKARVEEKSNDS